MVLFKNLVLREKFKEKKTMMTKVLFPPSNSQGWIMDVLLLPILLKVVKSIVPLVCSLNWVTHCIDTSRKAIILKVPKDYVPFAWSVSMMGPEMLHFHLLFLATCLLFFLLQ